MSPLRSSFLSLAVFLLFSLGAAPLSAQSLDTVLENMQAAYHPQFEAVDTYIVETNLYTSYNKRIRKNGEPAYKTEIRTKDGTEKTLATKGDPSTVHDIHFGRLKKHATYVGTDTLNGAQCHVLRLKHVSPLHANAAPNAKQVTYHIGADRHMPVRTTTLLEPSRSTQRQASTDRAIIVTMNDYRTTDGLVLPYRTEIAFDLDLSREKRRQMTQMMETMSERQRKQMQNAMGEKQIRMMNRMTSGEPILIEVEDVSVNAPLPDDVF